MTALFESLKLAIEKKIEEEIPTLGPSSALIDACAYALRNGGKRLRPIIVLITAKAIDPSCEPMDAAVAVEFFHTASLIADDLPCMDNEEERRGAPSLHCAFSETVALLASYALISSGYEKLQKNNRDAKRLALALASATFNTGIGGATGGQFLDLHVHAFNESKLREIVQKKTSSLFELSFVLGWLFGGGDPEKLPLVQKLSSHFGLAFQIADDFSDFVQDSKKKRAINLPLLLGKERAFQMLQDEAEGFNNTLSELSLQTTEFKKLTEYLNRYGALTV